MAARVLAATRPYDFIGRYGGEELIVVLPGVTRHRAMHCANRLKTAIAATPVQLPDGTGITVTCSFGLMSLSNSTVPTSEDLIRQADAALYVAKRQGRNRIEECAPDEIEAAFPCPPARLDAPFREAAR